MLTPGDDGLGGGRRSPACRSSSHADVVDTDPDRSDEYLLGSSGFLEPATLRLRRRSAAAVETLKQAPAFFDAGGLAVRQHFATSADGTRVPYFVVGAAGRGRRADPAHRVRRLRGAR